MLATCVRLSLLACAAGAALAVDCAVDATRPRQLIEGFGCTWQSEVFGTVDTLTASQRARLVDALFRQVGVRLGQSGCLVESPQSAGAAFFDQRANDDGDPATIAWSGFNSYVGDRFKAGIMDLAPAGTAGGVYPGILLNSRWTSPWLTRWYDDAGKQRALAECAEQALAVVTWWTRTYGVEPRWAHLTNEPFSGNGELSGMPEAWAPALVRACGDRLRAAGFARVKFIFSSDETEEKSLAIAQAVLADPAAAAYVAAIGYHAYPYGSVYASAANILATSGSGAPDPGRIAVRARLRDLAAAHGIECWMTEISHSELDATDFAAVRARAIHIHDEFAYADAAAYFGMNSSWSRTAQALHVGDGGAAFRSDSDSLVLTDQASDEVFITSMGRAIGHYARWLDAGRATRLEASSSDPLVLISAFRDDARGRLVAVMINDADAARTLRIATTGLTLSGQVVGERSTSDALWAPLTPFARTDAATIDLTLPALSVTTIAVDGATGGTTVGVGTTTGASTGGTTSGTTTGGTASAGASSGGGSSAGNASAGTTTAGSGGGGSASHRGCGAGAGAAAAAAVALMLVGRRRPLVDARRRG